MPLGQNQMEMGASMPPQMGMGDEMPSQMGMDDEMQSQMEMGDEMPSRQGGNASDEPTQQGQFDFGERFDPGVEADEDEDPKHFIQQLTGKLSQSLNSYEDKDDEGLYKYVGKMINRQVGKNLDDKGRKEMIRAINSSGSDSEDDEDYDMEDDKDMNMDDEYKDEQTPMSENRNRSYKRTLKPIYEEFGLMGDTTPLYKNTNAKKSRKSPFSPKRFKK